MKAVFLCVAMLLLAACTNANDLDKAPVELGDFRLGHNVAVAPNLTKGPASRDATEEEWIAAMTSAVDERFSRYEGDSLYHIAVSIEGYVLAVTGIPLVAAPKSALIIRVTAWDDAAGEKLNPEPELITVMETISGNTLLGSGLTQTKEVQIENLSRNAAKLIQNWLVRENAENGWFAPDEGDDADVPAAQDPATAEEQTELPEAETEPGEAAIEAADSALTPAEQATAISEVIIEPEVTPLPSATLAE